MQREKTPMKRETDVNFHLSDFPFLDSRQMPFSLSRAPRKTKILSSSRGLRGVLLNYASRDKLRTGR